MIDVLAPQPMTEGQIRDLVKRVRRNSEEAKIRASQAGIKCIALKRKGRWL